MKTLTILNWCFFKFIYTLVRLKLVRNKKKTIFSIFILIYSHLSEFKKNDYNS